jgi:hypothetical protein
MGLQHLRLNIYQDDFMRHRSFLFRNHPYRFFLLYNLLRFGSRGAGEGGVASSPPSSACSTSSSSSASSPTQSSPISIVIFVMSSSQALAVLKPNRIIHKRTRSIIVAFTKEYS